MSPTMYRPLMAFCALLLASCATLPTPQTAELSGEAVLCESANVAIITGYVTARADRCEVKSERAFALTIEPEAATDPQGVTINNSPWYGFKIEPKTRGRVIIDLNYVGGSHRYHPKVSREGRRWNRLSNTDISELGDDGARLTLDPGGAPLFVSAQEIFAPSTHNAFIDRMERRPDVTVSPIGQSARGTEIRQIDVQTEPARDKSYVVLVGRQHPPEVTGALALMPYVETVLSGSDLSEAFLERFNLLVIPMINPDGVESGHWRFGTGGMDLNRDWGPFSQPETASVRAALERFHRGDDAVVFFVDFHSTGRNLLYTQTDAEPTSPPMFTRDWVAAVKSRLPEEVYAFTREDRSNSGRPISKNYMYESFGIPSITYEVGDETDRAAIAQGAIIFAEEMMRLLVETAE